MTVFRTRRTRPWRAAILTAAALAATVCGTDCARAGAPFFPDAGNELKFPARQARFIRLTINGSFGSQPCIDELEVYAEGGKENLSQAARGARATASSCLAGHDFHRIEHLNDGRYGNSYSWIAAGNRNEWAQIELPEPAVLDRVVFSRDREGRFTDRMPRSVEVLLSMDGNEWQSVCREPGTLTSKALLRYAFLCERVAWSRMNSTDHLSPLRVERPAYPGGEPYWGRVARLDPLERALVQMEEMTSRLEAKGLNVSAERDELVELRRRQAAPGGKDNESLYIDARLAKRRLMFRDPDLEGLRRILFAKRHPYLASHNYSDVMDSQFRPGGGICVLDIPHRKGRLEPDEAKLTVLFDGSDGIARDPITDFASEKVYFAYRPDKSPIPGRQCYWHLMVMSIDGSSPRQISDGPFHDYFPCPLPDGGLAFISTRCKARFLCWRPQAFVLFRMDREVGDPRPLSFANLSEWTPAVMRDGRILWTRSEYQDKGANFGHTLWAIRPDGSHPELVFGNNTDNCYMNAHEVPGTRELVCTLVSHGGDHNGPIGLVDLSKGPFDPSAITSITPDVTPQYDMAWLAQRCFRDPIPVSRDYFLVSHAPADNFGIYLIDRFGNRELLYMDPEIGSMRPRPLGPLPTPPVLLAQEFISQTELGQFTVADVYRGLSPAVPRGKVKYIRVCQEVRSDLEQLANGEYRSDHPPFTDFYATPIHRVNGPFGWPSYVAKASLGLARVEEDGSANFYAPAGKVLYFQALDDDYNELQRMRSVVQLQPGEKRSCIGCHEDRGSTPPVARTIAARRPAEKLQAPPWGPEPFSYEKVVQPVWESKCAACHGAGDERGFNLSGTLDADRVPASYRTLISGGWVHYFNWGYAERPRKAEPMTFGTVKSKLWKVIGDKHHDAELTREEKLRIKCWIDLNCPLWPDYVYRMNR